MTHPVKRDRDIFMDEQRSDFLNALYGCEIHSETDKLPFILGMDSIGHTVMKDLAELPHILIAGATGTGKSTLAHAILLSLIQNTDPDSLKMILCDTKIVEFGRYSSIPHLLVPVITTQEKVHGILQWAQTEILRRFKLMSDSGVRSVDSYNEKASEKAVKPIPRVLMAIDDIAVAINSEETKSTVLSIAKNGRAAGIYIMLITQSPGEKQLAEIVRNAIPARAAFNVFSDLEKRLLLGNSKKMPVMEVGEFLFCKAQSSGKEKIRSYQITDDDIDSILSDVKDRHKDYKIDFIQIDTKTSHRLLIEPDIEELEGDEMLPVAVDVVLETGMASVSMLQRRLKLGYARAARIVDEMEGKGLVGPFQGSKPRAILITKDQWQEIQNGTQIDFDDSDAYCDESSDEDTPHVTDEDAPTDIDEEPETIPDHDDETESDQEPSVTQRRKGFWGFLDWLTGTPQSRPTESKNRKSDKTIYIDTEEELIEFLESHELVKDFHTKVVGVTYNNDDGSSRQKILSMCRDGESVVLRSFKYQGAPAIAVLTDHGQIGFLSASLVADIDAMFGKDIIFCATISSMTGGENGLYYGCNLHVLIYK